MAALAVAAVAAVPVAAAGAQGAASAHVVTAAHAAAVSGTGVSPAGRSLPASAPGIASCAVPDMTDQWVCGGTGHYG